MSEPSLYGALGRVYGQLAYERSRNVVMRSRTSRIVRDYLPDPLEELTKAAEDWVTERLGSAALFDEVLRGTCANAAAMPPMEPHPTCVFATAAAIRSLHAAITAAGAEE